MKSHQKAAWIAEIRALSALALPFVIGNLAWSLVAASNLFLLGRVSAEAMAAGSLATNLYNALQIFGMGIATAVSPMIARERGRRKFAVRDIRRTVRQGMWVTLAICLPVWALLWHAESILLALGQQAALSAQAASLLRGLQWALLPYLWFYVLRHYVGAMERPIWGVIITLIALPVNFLAGWTLILGNLGMPALGLFGAGLASSLTAVTMLVAIVIVISRDRQFRRFQLFGRFWVADWPRFGSLLRLGMPIAVLFAMEVTVFNAAAFLMGTIGQASLAAHAIANQAAALAFMIPLGISQAATIRAGLGFGRGDADAVRRSGRVALTVGVGFAVAAATLLAVLPTQFIGLFLDLRDPANVEVVRLATSFIYVAALFQLFDSTQAVSAGLLRGLHDTKVPMIIAATGYWVFGMGIGSFLAFRTPLAGLGIWIGLASGLAVVAPFLAWRWFSTISRLAVRA